MNFKAILDKNIAQIDYIQNELHLIGEAFTETDRDEKVLFNRLLGLMEKYPGNSSIYIKFLTLIQLSDDPECFNGISLDEIAEVFKKLTTHFPLDMDTWSEYFYYLDNVMNNDAWANKIKQEILKKFDNLFKDMPSY